MRQGKHDILSQSKVDITPFPNELFEVMNHKARIGFVDKEGRKVIRCRFDWASLNGFQEGLCLVAIRKDNNIMLGYIDKKGRMVIDCSQFDYAKDFKCGYAPVQKNGLWGLIDKTGHEVVSCVYTSEEEIPLLCVK